MARRADVPVEKHRGGMLDQCGLGYEQLREINPRLVYCSITGFGSAAGAALTGTTFWSRQSGG